MKDVCIENFEQLKLLDYHVMSMLLINRWRSLELLRYILIVFVLSNVLAFTLIKSTDVDFLAITNWNANNLWIAFVIYNNEPKPSNNTLKYYLVSYKLYTINKHIFIQSNTNVDRILICDKSLNTYCMHMACGMWVYEGYVWISWKYEDIIYHS